MTDLTRIWYVAPQRLCNYHCDYCVSIGDYAKSNTFDWRESDLETFKAVVSWIGTRPFDVGVRLGTLGEPFASKEFLAQAAWLSRQDNVCFLELLTNGSLLKARLPRFAEIADLQKVSLWVTHHHTQVSVDRFIENAVFAQEEYGLFVVVNALFFPENRSEIEALRSAADAAGLRFNLDFGYEPGAPSTPGRGASEVIPVLHLSDGVDAAIALGARPEVLRLNLTALDHPKGHLCAAGHKYIYIGIEGDVYRCSRYHVLKKDRLGNVLDPEFELNLRQREWEPCAVESGCCNKEDFLNLKTAAGPATLVAPSLGWIGE